MQCTAPKPLQNRAELKARRSFPGTPRNVGAARAWVETTLQRWEVDEPDQLTLVVSELTTNAVTHTLSGRPGQQFTVRLSVFQDRVRVAVKDAGPKPGRTPTLRTPSPDAKHGRGLALVNMLSLSWKPLTVGTGVQAEVAR